MHGTTFKLTCKVKAFDKDHHCEVLKAGISLLVLLVKKQLSVLLKELGLTQYLYTNLDHIVTFNISLTTTSTTCILQQ